MEQMNPAAARSILGRRPAQWGGAGGDGRETPESFLPKNVWQGTEGQRALGDNILSHKSRRWVEQMGGLGTSKVWWQQSREGQGDRDEMGLRSEAAAKNWPVVVWDEGQTWFWSLGKKNELPDKKKFT